MRKSRVLFLAALSIFMSACGGGGSSSTPTTTTPTPQPTSPEGVYSGTVTGSQHKNFQMVILENGDTWTLYGTDTATASYIAGFMQGTVTWTNTTFASSNAKDFGTYPPTPGTITGSYNSAAKTASGTASDGKATLSFSGATPVAATYNYLAPADLSKISGNWSLTTFDGVGILMSISSAGKISAAASTGCTLDGSATPRPSGKNIFNVSLVFSGSACVSKGVTASGIALSYPIGNNKTQLIIAGVDTTRALGTVAFGAR